MHLYVGVLCFLESSVVTLVLADMYGLIWTVIYLLFVGTMHVIWVQMSESHH